VAIKTYREQLEEVQAAISAVLSGAQDYQLNGRRITRANLGELDRREKYLRAMVDRETNGDGVLARWGE